MFTLEKEFRFEASHRLPLHDGKCQRLHGHSWAGKVILQGDELQASGPQSGMLQDFGRVSAALKPLLEEKLDHWHLNETTGLSNPTSEELARWVFNHLKPLLHLLVAVRIEETCTSACTFKP